MTTALSTCPPWCIVNPGEHDFERANNFPVEHVQYVRSDVGGSAEVSVSVGRTDMLDGTTTVVIGVQDDDYTVDQAEQTAMAMLEAVKLARS